MTETYKQTNKVKALLVGTDGARKRDFRFSILTRNIVGTASYWSGGSINYYVAINMADGGRVTPAAGTFPDFKAEFTVTPGTILLQTGLCMGRAFSATFHCLPEDEQAAREWLGVARFACGSQTRKPEPATVEPRGYGLYPGLVEMMTPKI